MKVHAALKTAALLAALPLLGVGCVQQGRYDSLIKTNRSLEEQLVRAEDERDTAIATQETLRSRLTSASQQVIDLQARNATLATEVDELSRSFTQMRDRIAGLQFGPLPEDLEQALEQLAADHPNMLAFDPRLGMLRFASDFTFGLGSIELSPEAQQTLATLATILNSEKASRFEVRVVGHTDNVPIGRPETRQQHPTNVHLSAHRAISVRGALVQAGVDPVRIQVAGYGEFRPVVVNGPRGAAENRRVEIYLTPLPAGTIATTPSSESPETVTGPITHVPEPMK